MATYTENLKLIKPDGNDPASQIPFNENADILDKTIAQIASYAGNAWNYVKTIDCNFDGDIPQTDLNIIKEMFNNGVTLWHNPSTIYNYSNSNGIV